MFGPSIVGVFVQFHVESQRPGSHVARGKEKWGEGKVTDKKEFLSSYMGEFTGQGGVPGNPLNSFRTEKNESNSDIPSYPSLQCPWSWMCSLLSSRLLRPVLDPIPDIGPRALHKLPTDGVTLRTQEHRFSSFIVFVPDQ